MQSIKKLERVRRWLRSASEYQEDCISAERSAAVDEPRILLDEVIAKHNNQVQHKFKSMRLRRKYTIKTNAT